MSVWAAVLAFAGGVVAVSLKGYADYLLERRRERRTLQVAARLVYEELWLASMAIGGDMWMGDVPDYEALKRDAWDKYEDVIGPELDFENWRLVLVGYGALADARDTCEGHIEEGRSEKLTDREMQDVLFELLHSIAAARDIVGELIDGFEKDPFPAGKWELSDD